MASTQYTDDGGIDPDLFLVHPVVFRYDADATDPQDRYELLANVVCMSIEFFDNDRAPEAQFRYEFDAPYLGSNDPTHFERVLPVDAPPGPGVVQTDDRLVVRVYYSDGSWSLVWDGFAQVPQGNVSGKQELVNFLGVGTPVREWDVPIIGAVYRDGDDGNLGADRTTDRHVRFNPEGKPNGTLDGYDHGTEARDEEGDGEVAADVFPVFIDHLIERDPEVRRFWSVGMAARYVMFSRALYGVPVDKWVNFYDPSDYDAVLESRVPVPDPDGVIDPDDPSTYKDTPIQVQDLTVTDDPWPEALRKLIEPHGFSFRFELDEDENGDPDWWVKIVSKNETTPVKKLFLQKADDSAYSVPLDVGLTNATSFTLQRDNHDIKNSFVAATALVRIEVAVLLAPGFPIDPSDALPANLSKWNPKSAVGTYDPVKYRIYHAAEAGDPWWDFAAGALSTKVTDFSPVFGKPAADGTPTYAVLRPPHGEAIPSSSRTRRGSGGTPSSG